MHGLAGSCAFEFTSVQTGQSLSQAQLFRLTMECARLVTIMSQGHSEKESPPKTMILNNESDFLK